MVGGVDIGEADRVVRFLSPDLGRWAAVARGARSSRRRYAGMFDLGNRVRVDAKAGRGDLWSLRDAERVSGPRMAREDYDRLVALSYGVELAAALAPEHAAAERLFGLLCAFLENLEIDPPAALRTSFESKALAFAGLGAVLDRCARCAGGLEGDLVFSLDEGGAAHARCATGRPVSRSDLDALQADLRRPMREAVARLEDPWLLARFAEHQLGRRLRSLDLLAGTDVARGTG